MASFEIASRRIGDDAPVFIIAELSANHGHSLDVALRTVEAAAKVGADAIKLQTYTADTLTLRSDASPFIVRTKNAWAGRTLHDLYAEAATPWEWHGPLKAAAEAAGLLFFSTPFDPTAVAFLEDLGVPAYKVASFELIDLPLVERIARTGKPVIASTGMATLGEIEAAVHVCREAGNDRLALLRCVSSYPADPAAMNLRSLAVLSSFPVVPGLSDHTRDHTVAVAAVALGARIIEKHFILDRSVGGPDAFFSLEPNEFKAMVDAVRTAEASMGPPRFGPAVDERASVTFRRSLFVARNIIAGKVLTCDDVRSVRPAHGLHPRYLPDVLGRTAARDVPAGTPLAWEFVGPPAESVALSLRPATSADRESLLAWRNDLATRAASLNSAEVTREEHGRWLRDAFASDNRTLLIAERDSNPVGVVRLDRRSNGESEVSITVAPAERGQGLAAAMLRALEAPAREQGVLVLVARIRVRNDASTRAFKNAGYYGFIESRSEGAGVVRCERRLTPYP